ncbi:hypothetical protein OPV22_005345 [Ensete ventricosum]|uniref:Uncharacterized protein n=1 Tax=Ensete ventricosum TaxID=4639 RepID=A0AAV8RKT4_ENSVE|nr:hypothetical protein OPV22_005345 [Ensete ventricosum]
MQTRKLRRHAKDTKRFELRRQWKRKRTQCDGWSTALNCDGWEGKMNGTATSASKDRLAYSGHFPSWASHNNSIRGLLQALHAAIFDRSL